MLVSTNKKTITKRPDNSRYQIYSALILSSKRTVTANHITGNFLQQSVLGLSLDLTEGKIGKNFIITAKFYFSAPVCLFWSFN